MKDNKAKSVLAFATHGLFSANAMERINNSVLDKVVITNTVPFKKEKETHKIEILSIGVLLAEAIRRIHLNESISQVFPKVK